MPFDSNIFGCDGDPHRGLSFCGRFGALASHAL